MGTLFLKRGSQRWILWLLLLLLSACGPRGHELLYQGPQSQEGPLSPPNGGSFDFRLTSSTNCTRVGRPITLTLELGNASAATYTAALPNASIIDIKLRGVRDVYWSETVSVTQQVRQLNLAAGESINVQMAWVVDPAVVGPEPTDIAVDTVIRYADPQGHIQTYVRGKYLVVSINQNVAHQGCL